MGEGARRAEDDQRRRWKIGPLIHPKNPNAMSTPIVPTDLTQRPPRSMRARLGSFVLLPRILDKGRAKLAGKNGEYNYNSPTDQHLVRFLGLDLEALSKELATGKGDGEILEWVHANAKTPRAPWEIEAWSGYMEKRGPESDGETLSFFCRIRWAAHQDSRRYQDVVRRRRSRRLRQLRRESLTR